MKSILLNIGLAVLFFVLASAPAAEGQQRGAVEIVTLDEAYRQALKNNELILIAAEEIEKSRLSSDKADALMLPRLNLYARYTKLDNPIEFEAELGDLSLPPVTTIPEEQMLGNANLIQPLYQAEWFPRKKQAEDILKRSSHDYGWIAQGVLYEVAQAYFEIIRANNYIMIAEDSLQRSYEEKRIAEIKFNEGVVTEDSVLSAELKITSSQNRLVTDKSTLRLARYMLKQLINSTGEDFEVVEPPESSSLNGTIEDLVSVAREERLDYRSAMSMVGVAQFEIDAVKSRFQPSLEGEVNYYTVDDPAFDQNDESWKAMLTLRIPIYQGGIRFADLKTGEHELKQARLRVATIEKDLRMQIEKAQVAMEASRAEIENLEKQSDLARKNYDIVLAKYRHGATNYVDINQAFDVLEKVQRELVARKYDYRLAVLQLERAAGIFGKSILAEK